MALIEVRSVYDTDGLAAWAKRMLTAADLPRRLHARHRARPRRPTPTTRARQVADLARMKDPADPAYHCAPARFVRADARRGAAGGHDAACARRSARPSSSTQQILGYAPVEPDGSFKLTVPADTPLALAVIDAKGRAFQTHTNWIQVRPGERRTCDGCHSPRRGAALNSGARRQHACRPRCCRRWPARTSRGETMAGDAHPPRPHRAAAAARHGVHRRLGRHRAPGRRPRARRSRSRYTGNANAADDLATPVPANGIINYPDHIRRSGRATAAPTPAPTATPTRRALDLRATIAGTGRLTSYEELLLGDPVIDPVTGLPVTRLEEGVPRSCAARRWSRPWPAKARSGLARKSRLGEILFGETLMAGADGAHRAPEPAGDRAEPRDAAQRGREAPGHRVDGPGRPVLQRPVRRRARRARRSTASARRRSSRQVFPMLQQHLRRRLPPGRSAAPGGAGRRHLVPQQPLRAHRQCGGRLRRHAVDDLEHLQPGVELPAEPAVDRAAPVGRAASRPPCCRWAARATTRSPTGSPPDAARMTLDATVPATGSLPAAAALRRRWRSRGCGGGGSTRWTTRRRSNNPPGAGGQKLSFAYFQRCVNPIFLAQLPITSGGSISTNTCAGSGCHDDANGTGGAFRVVATRQRGRPGRSGQHAGRHPRRATCTRTSIRRRARCVIGSPRRAGCSPSRWCTACCTAAA